MDLLWLSKGIAFVVALTVHEFFHAFVANKLGDPTAKYADRLSLNPLKHIDPFGTVILPLVLLWSQAPFVFGWAKPVPVNPYNLKGKHAEAWVSLAGPAANFLVATVLAFGLRSLPDQLTASFSEQFFELIIVIIGTNVFIGVFNLLPFPPLDGSKILLDFFPSISEKFRDFFERYGVFLLIFFILFAGQFIYGLTSLIIGLLLGGSFISS